MSGMNLLHFSDRLTANIDVIRGLLNAVSEDQARWKPQPEKWSLLEVINHLADEEADRLLPEAVEVIREYDRASASLLQRRLKVGYARAARMIDQLEARGYIGAFDGSNARVVLRRDATPPAVETEAGLDEDDG